MTSYDSETIIKAENLTKIYAIGKVHTLKRGLKGLIEFILNKPPDIDKAAKMPKEYIIALNRVSFEIKKGEIVGIIGRNGAGKTTLLKILSKITSPTYGRAEVFGKIIPIIGLGIGFLPDFTGFENIYLNATILGMRKSSIKKTIDRIIEFAEIENFIDTPIKRYSSGMVIRLGMAICLHIDADILIVDEALAVGDITFQKKCLKRLEELMKEGKTILFVSHDISHIASLCTRVILLEKGQIIYDGDVNEGISRYLESTSSTQGIVSWTEGVYSVSFPYIKIMSVSVHDNYGRITNSFDGRFPFSIKLHCNIEKSIPPPDPVITFKTRHGIPVVKVLPEDNKGIETYDGYGQYFFNMEIPAGLLSPGTYFISITLLGENHSIITQMENILTVNIENTVDPLINKIPGITVVKSRMAVSKNHELTNFNKNENG